MLIKDIEINRDKIFEQDEYSKFVIKQAHKRGDLLDTVRVILKFNELIQLNLTCKNERCINCYVLLIVKML